ncbi:MAG: DUF1178 family protein [Hyphomicrobiales bacterium]|nr:DUF1178 family protein [Hyphomicrobiales bacterium]
MIKYSLKCSDGHQYEAWFASSAAYEALAKAGELQCPVCGTSDIGKALMTPGIPVRQNSRDTAPAVAQKPQPQTVAAPANSAQQQAEAVKVLRKLREIVETNSDYVGPKFAEEARKIHYEEAEARSIYGEASHEELTELDEDGISFYPLPVLPEDHN